MGLLDTWREVRQQIIDSKPTYEPFITPQKYESPFVSTLGVDDATPTNVASAAPLRRKPLPLVHEGPDHTPVYKPAPPSLTDQIREGFSFGLGPVSEEDRLDARKAYARLLDEPNFPPPPAEPLRLQQDSVLPSIPSPSNRVTSPSHYPDTGAISNLATDWLGRGSSYWSDVGPVGGVMSDPNLFYSHVGLGVGGKDFPPYTKAPMHNEPSYAFQPREGLGGRTFTKTPTNLRNINWPNVSGIAGAEKPVGFHHEQQNWVDTQIQTHPLNTQGLDTEKIYETYMGLGSATPSEKQRNKAGRIIEEGILAAKSTRPELWPENKWPENEVAQEAAKLQAQINQPDPALINMHPDYVAGADRRKVPSLIDAAADQIADDEAEKGGLMGLLSGPLNRLKQRQQDASDIYGINPIAGIMAGAGIPLASMLMPNPLSLPFSLLTMLGGEDRTPYDFYGQPVTDIKHGRGGMNWYGADIPGAGIYSRTKGRLGPAGAPITIHSPSGLLESTITDDGRGYNITPKMSAIAQTPEIVGMTGADYFGTGDDYGMGTTVTGETFDWADFY